MCAGVLTLEMSACCCNTMLSAAVMEGSTYDKSMDTVLHVDQYLDPGPGRPEKFLLRHCQGLSTR